MLHNQWFLHEQYINIMYDIKKKIDKKLMLYIYICYTCKYEYMINFFNCGSSYFITLLFMVIQLSIIDC